jgi:hypothetical protein
VVLNLPGRRGAVVLVALNPVRCTLPGSALLLDTRGGAAWSWCCPETVPHLKDEKGGSVQPGHFQYASSAATT